MDKKYPRLSMNGFESDETRLARINRARKEAEKAADLLKKDFGTKEVLLFGSLVDCAYFGAHSDIDLAVRGMPVKDFYRATSILMDTIEEFDFDLVDVDACKPALRESILRTGVML